MTSTEMKAKLDQLMQREAKLMIRSHVRSKAQAADDAELIRIKAELDGVQFGLQMAKVTEGELEVARQEAAMRAAEEIAADERAGRAGGEEADIDAQLDLYDARDRADRAEREAQELAEREEA